MRKVKALQFVNYTSHLLICEDPNLSQTIILTFGASSSGFRVFNLTCVFIMHPAMRQQKVIVVYISTVFAKVMISSE